MIELPALCIAMMLSAISSEQSLGALRTEALRYLRPAGSEFVLESQIELKQDSSGTLVSSVTLRPRGKLTLDTQSDRTGRLDHAVVTTEDADKKETASVTVSQETACVARMGQEDVKLDCPPGIIVTSAPDWTDAFLMVRRYDLHRVGTQEFPGLWVHPTQQPLRLTFRLTRRGDERIEHLGKSVQLHRFLVELRGGDRYIAWGDEQGTLIRLLQEKSPSGGIVLSGWEHAAEVLRP